MRVNKDLQIIKKKISDIKPYERNPRKNDDAVKFVAESLEAFGWKQPIVIDKDGVIVCGHTRYKAAQRLKMKEVPCVIADDLSDEEINAYRLADNKVSEKASWDFNLLDEEINGILSFDMTDFGFEFIDREKNKKDTQKRVESILNLEIASFDGTGKYDIPEIDPIHKEDIGEIKEWIRFNDILTDKEPQGKAVHFFIDDYKFIRIWNNPEKYIEKLLEYEAVLTPDFSPYADMPMATQIFNHYRKHWIGALMQAYGVKVIPTIRASMDKRSLEWYLDGEPEGGVVAYSSMWIKKGTDQYKYGKKEFGKMVEKLKPEKVYVYGKHFDFMGGVETECIEPWARKFFDN